jgi:hypothetical protein
MDSVEDRRGFAKSETLGSKSEPFLSSVLSEYAINGVYSTLYRVYSCIRYGFGMNPDGLIRCRQTNIS